MTIENQEKVKVPKKTLDQWRKEQAARKEKERQDREAFLEHKAEELLYLKDKEEQKVRGTFHYYEVPQGALGFSFRKYPGEPIQKYVLFDGQEYTLPLGVALHLNENGWYPRYEYLKNESGLVMAGHGLGNSATVLRVAQKVRRFGFTSNDFRVERDSNTVIASSERAS